MTTPNKTLNQIISEIASRANTGRLDISWDAINRKRILSEGALNVNNQNDEDKDEEKDTDKETADSVDPIDKLLGDSGKEDAEKDTGGTQDATTKDTTKTTKDTTKDDSVDNSEESIDADKKDASVLNAKAEVAKAEKAAAEQELEDNSYLKLNSNGGLSFLLQKILDGAFKTNTIDALASEFSSKLRITNQDDYNVFADDMIPFNTIPGMPELLSSIQTKITPGSTSQAGNEDVK